MTAFIDNHAATSPLRLNSLLKAVLGLLLMVVVAVLSLPAQAQTGGASLTPEQRRQLEALPQSQQDQLRQQFESAQPTPSGAPSTQRDTGDDDATPDSQRGPSGVTSVEEAERAEQERIEAEREAERRREEEEAEESEQESEPPRRPRTALEREYDAWRDAVDLPASDLIPFGYDFFAGTVNRFESADQLSVPRGYQVGRGDQVRILMVGRQNRDFNLTINRDGNIEIPEIGPVNVAGRTLEGLRDYLGDIISERYIGVETFISLGDLRSIQVFVAGESRNPGMYTVNAYSTLSFGLAASGGVRFSGTLRDIRLLRDGEVHTQFDVYDLLLRGSREQDRQLEAGDVIFIPPTGERVAVEGAVVRPGLYELKDENTVEDVIAMAGGLRAQADPSRVQVSRLQAETRRTLADLRLPDDQSYELLNGDSISIGQTLDRLRGAFELRGATPLAGEYNHESDMRLSRFIQDRDDDLDPETDLEFGVIVSRTGDTYRTSLRAFSPRNMLDQPGTDADPVLSERDTVIFFEAGASRLPELEPILGSLSSERTDGLPPLVRVNGAVAYPGRYPLLENPTAGALIQLAGGLARDDNGIVTASTDSALLVRRTGEHQRQLDLQSVHPERALQASYTASGTADNPELQALDQLLVFPHNQSRRALLDPVLEELQRNTPEDMLPQILTIDGVVRFPGRYPVLDDLTPRTLVNFAGGLARDDRALIAADLEFGVLARRQGDFGRDLRLNHFSPRGLLESSSSEGAHSGIGSESVAADLMPFQPLDRILLFSDTESRTTLLEPLFEEVSANLLPGQLPPVIGISGAVRHPGNYPLFDNKTTTVADLISYAGGLTNASYELEAELIRQRLGAERAESELVTLGLRDDAPRSVEMRPADRLNIKQLPELNLERTVTLSGEFRFPGSYTIRRGETLSQVIERAGGLTEEAYDRGAVFTREALREQEQERLDDARRRLQRNLVLQGGGDLGTEDAISTDQATVTNVLDQLAEAQAVGRLVIDLPGLLSGDNTRDIRLQDGDTLTVPEIQQSVSVIGEVQFATSHLFSPDLGVTDYINRSGGLASQADGDRIYIVQADGSVTRWNDSRWYTGRERLQPGDTIVVPLDLERISGLALASDLSQVIYQIALGASAVSNF